MRRWKKPEWLFKVRVVDDYAEVSMGMHTLADVSIKYANLSARAHTTLWSMTGENYDVQYGDEEVRP